MNGRRALKLVRVLACAAVVGSAGCGFYAYVTPARRLADVPETKADGEPQAARGFVFRCYDSTIWGRQFYDCADYQKIASRMMDDASARLDGGTKEVREQTLEVSFGEHPNRGPLAVLRGLASFVTELCPISISQNEDRWTLEVKTTSNSGKTIERSYETSSLVTGSVYISLISIPGPPKDARRVVGGEALLSHAESTAGRESLRSLVAGFVVDEHPHVCSGLSCGACPTGAEKTTEACLDCGALKAACIQ